MLIIMQAEIMNHVPPFVSLQFIINYRTHLILSWTELNFITFITVTIRRPAIQRKITKWTSHVPKCMPVNVLCMKILIKLECGMNFPHPQLEL